VINDNIEQASSNLLCIIHAERLKTKRIDNSKIDEIFKNEEDVKMKQKRRKSGYYFFTSRAG